MLNIFFKALGTSIWGKKNNLRTSEMLSCLLQNEI